MSGFLLPTIASPAQAVAPGDPLYGKHATVAVGRVSQDLGKGSSLGAIYTDEEFGQGWNRIGGLDFTARLNQHWTAWGQMVESSTMGDEDSGTPPPYCCRPRERIPTAALRPCLQPEGKFSGHEHRLPDAAGLHPGLQLPQQPDARDLSVVSQEAVLSELRPRDQPERRLRSPGRPRLSLFHLRSLLAAAAQHRHRATSSARTPTPSARSTTRGSPISRTSPRTLADSFFAARPGRSSTSTCRPSAEGT